MAGTSTSPSGRQLMALGWIYFAYVNCYLLRKNFPLLLPDLAEESLLTTVQAGIVASTFETVVGIVKFFCGVYVDAHPDPAGLLATCLFVAAGSTLALWGVFQVVVGAELATLRLVLVAGLWSFNGAGQAVAWPALARVFMAWFPDPAIRGFWYSMLATNQNLGGTLSPRVYPPLMAEYGWEVALLLPAGFTLVYAAAMKLNLVSKMPEDAEAAETEAGGGQKAEKAEKAKPDKPDKPKGPGFVETMLTLFKMPAFLCLCFAYIPVMVIRISLANWSAVIFQASSMTMFEAGACISALEIGGFVGGLTGGYVSDTFFGGRRGPVMCVFSLICAPLALAYQFLMDIEGDSVELFGVGVSKLIALQVVYFLIGCFSFPPHSLIGLTSRELVPENMRSTAGCIAKAVGQLGAAAGGLPLQQLAATHGWGCVGYVNAACGVVAAIIFAPLWFQEPLAKTDSKKAK